MRYQIPDDINPGKSASRGTALATWRREAVGSQDDFVKLSGVGRRTMQYWEAGERPLPPYIRPLLLGVLELKRNAGPATKD